MWKETAEESANAVGGRWWTHVIIYCVTIHHYQQCATISKLQSKPHASRFSTHGSGTPAQLEPLQRLGTSDGLPIPRVQHAFTMQHMLSRALRDKPVRKRKFCCSCWEFAEIDILFWGDCSRAHFYGFGVSSLNPVARPLLALIRVDVGSRHLGRELWIPCIMVVFWSP